MTEIVKFEMSGRRFEIDPTATATLLDLDVIAETRIDLQSAGALLAAVASGERPPDVEAVRAIGALAYLAAVRAGSSESWREFARQMDPQTLRIVTDDTPAPAAAPAASDEDALLDRLLARAEERKTTTA
ncbi:MAG: hypothetical protein AB7G23_20265 [Vicinamibacterales bacterium]